MSIEDKEGMFVYDPKNEKEKSKSRSTSKNQRLLSSSRKRNMSGADADWAYDRSFIQGKDYFVYEDPDEKKVSESNSMDSQGEVEDEPSIHSFSNKPGLIKIDSANKRSSSMG